MTPRASNGSRRVALRRYAPLWAAWLAGAALPLPPPVRAPAPAPAPATATALAPAPAAAPSPDAPTRAAGPPGSATEGEVARLARLAQADAATRAADASVRDAPGRRSLEADGLRRCVDATGGSIFTDRRCDSLGADDAPPELAAPRIAPARPVSVRSCARSKDDLLDGVRNALEVHDVNRFADYYHWTGMDGATGYRLMDRLEAMTRRPFIDAQLVSSARPRTPATGPGESAGLLSRPFDLPDGPLPAAPAPPATPPRPHPADLLRVDQMRSDRDAGALVTWFRLRSNAGCWWVTY